MKLCLLSDIHGNKHAFDAALPLILEERADATIFLGDICGYYFETIAVWRELQKIPNLIALSGNHDALFLKFAAQGFVPASYTKKYGPALEILLKHNPEELYPFLCWLGGLQHSYYSSENQFQCFHGGPNSPATEYIYPDTPLPDVEASFVFTGHTHCPMIRAKKNTVYCNPGSLGQPRHGSCASFATMNFDKEHWRWDVHNIVFDKDALISSLATFDLLPHYLTAVLRK